MPKKHRSKKSKTTTEGVNSEKSKVEKKVLSNDKRIKVSSKKLRDSLIKTGYIVSKVYLIKNTPCYLEVVSEHSLQRFWITIPDNILLNNPVVFSSPTIHLRVCDRYLTSEPVVSHLIDTYPGRGTITGVNLYRVIIFDGKNIINLRVTTQESVSAVQTLITQNLEAKDEDVTEVENPIEEDSVTLEDILDRHVRVELIFVNTTYASALKGNESLTEEDPIDDLTADDLTDNSTLDEIDDVSNKYDDHSRGDLKYIPSLGSDLLEDTPEFGDNIFLVYNLTDVLKELKVNSDKLEKKLLSDYETLESSIKTNRSNRVKKVKSQLDEIYNKLTQTIDRTKKEEEEYRSRIAKLVEVLNTTEKLRRDITDPESQKELDKTYLQTKEMLENYKMELLTLRDRTEEILLLSESFHL